MSDRKILISTDWHYPLVDRGAMRRFERKAFNEYYDAYVVLGDTVDFQSISRFVAGKPGLMSERIDAECKKVIDKLSYHASLLQVYNRNVKLFFMAGNHEGRLDDWLERNPQFEGCISIPKLLDLKRLGYSYIAPNKKLKIGNVTFMHGAYCGVGHARKTASGGGINIYGHTHSLESATYESWDGSKGRAYSMGCLAQTPMDYLKGKMGNATHGYGVAILGKKTDVLQYRV